MDAQQFSAALQNTKHETIYAILQAVKESTTHLSVFVGKRNYHSDFDPEYITEDISYVDADELLERLRGLL